MCVRTNHSIFFELADILLWTLYIHEGEAPNSYTKASCLGMACITEAIGARMSHDFGVPNDLLHHIVMFLNSYDLVQLSSTTKALNKRISESTVVWSHIGHYDFNEISIGIGNTRHGRRGEEGGQRSEQRQRRSKGS